jgi:DNA-binding IclR family transcriptional regulator
METVGDNVKKERKPAKSSTRRGSSAPVGPRGEPRTAKSHRARKADRTGSGTAKAEGGVAAVDRALEILAAFEPTDKALTLAELAQRTKFYKSTILRLAQSLLRHNYLQRLDDGSYRIGPAPLMLGALYQRSMRVGDILLPLMHELAEQTGESVSIYTRNGDVRVCIHRVDSKHAVRDHVREGDVLPLERGSGGRILLAFGGAKGEPYETIRAEYCYASVGERDSETAGLSVPFFGTGQAILGALTLAGPRSRIDETFIANARVLLLRVACRATNSLGGDASPIEAALAMTLAGKRPMARPAKMGART